MNALTPMDFDEANMTMGKAANMTDVECKPLRVYTDGRECISCWHMTWRQRISALLHGRIWLSVLSGRTQPPVWLDCGKTVFIQEGNDND